MHISNLFVPGLKQGCAALSDMSFVFIRNGEKMSFGIIAKRLQHEAGCYLPSFELDPDKDVKEHLREILNYKDLTDVASCVEQYGFGSVETGIQMLSSHLDGMNDSENMGLYDHVFKLVITDVKMKNDNEEEEGIMMLNNDLALEVSQTYDYSDDDEKKIEVVSSSSSARRSKRPSTNSREPTLKTNSNPSRYQNLLQQLQKELPRYYIHIPDRFNITINSERVNFHYWQRHLVEPFRFDQGIDENESFRDRKNFQEPAVSNVKVRVFCGFDPIRLNDKTLPSTLSVFIYSRRSGRLIKHVPDGRNMLGLTAGGTTYCQGLTCIIDDFNGAIPLNPTKQDVAFSERRNGELLGENLYAWSAAITSLYYKYHLEKFQNKRKGDLTAELEPMKEDLLDLYGDFSSNSNSHKIKLLANSDFGVLDGIIWTRINGSITSRMTTSLREIEGRDSKFKLLGNKSSKRNPKTSSAQKGGRRSNAKRKASIMVAEMELPLSMVLSDKKPTRKKAKVDYSMESEASESDTENYCDVVYSNSTAKKTSQSQMIKDLTLQLKQKKHDHETLSQIKKNLQDENERMFEEIDHLKAKQRSSNANDVKNERNEDEYELLEEVKNNLQDENDRLAEETEYLTAKLAAVQKKLQAERSLRVSVEDELRVLEERTERSKSRGN